MSKGRLFSRPRTKVYETNYNIGESYYKPALDNLDRKYGGRGFVEFDRGLAANGDAFGTRHPPPIDMPSPRAAMREMEDGFFGEGQRRRPNSALLGEYNAIFEGRMRNGVAKERTPLRSRALDDEIEEDLSSSMRRLKTRASRSLADEFEDMESSLTKKESIMRPRLDFADKMMDSVGLTGKVRQLLEEEGSTIGRRFLKITASSSESTEGGDMTKWTALKSPAIGRRQFLEDEEDMTKWTALKSPAVGRRQFLEDEEESLSQGAAAARARKSRARLEDLESEMQAISEKSAAREKRVRDLKALVQENEASALDNLQTTVRMKNSVQSEKKTVTF